MSRNLIEFHHADSVVSIIETTGGVHCYWQNDLMPLWASNFDALGLAILELNRDAFCHRYQGRHNPPADFPDYRYTRRDIGTSVAALKMLSYVIYQCAEGDCEHVPLWQWLRRVEAGLAKDIVTALPAWRAAPWG